MVPAHYLDGLVRVHLPKDREDPLVGHIALSRFFHRDAKTVVGLPDDLLRACVGSDPDFDIHGAETRREKAPESVGCL